MRNPSISITIEGAGFLRKKIGTRTIVMPPGSRVSDIKKQFPVDTDLRVIVFVNRKKASDSHALHNGDLISIVPIFFGG